MQPGPLACYRSNGKATDPGRHAHLYAGLPLEVPALVRSVQGLIVDKDFVRLYELALAERERLGEVDTRYLPNILERLLAKDGRSLLQAREPAARFVGSCRDYALLLCSMLRHLGIPARIRFGFATYFSKQPDTYSDHCACEYWDDGERRWLLVDPNVDPVVKSSMGVTANELDLSRDEFLVASDAWRVVRNGQADPDHFGVPSIGIQGLWFIRGSLMRDLAALNKVEMLPWDYWGLADRMPIDALPREEMPFLDDLAAALANSDELAAIQAAYSRDGLTVPSMIRSFSPLHGQTEIEVHY
jgi:hypothetical protein